MPAIHRCDLPADALLSRYQYDGAYADCYVATIARRVAHAEYVEAFYTTTLFRTERLLLSLFASRPSTDAEAKQLAAGTRDTFAAWTVEARIPDQLLLADFQGRTRSWLMVQLTPDAASAGTRLYFGSAVVPARGAKANASAPTLVPAFRLLLGFHKLYSRALLTAAASRLA